MIDMEIGFQIIAVILAGVAAFFYWNGESDRTFVAAIFAACSWFLAYRFRIKSRLATSNTESKDILRK